MNASSFWWDVKPLVNVLCNALCTHSALTEREWFAPVLLVGLAKFIKLLDLHLVICSIFRPSLIKQPGLHEFSLPLYCCFQCFSSFICDWKYTTKQICFMIVKNWNVQTLQFCLCCSRALRSPATSTCHQISRDVQGQPL